MLNPPTRGNSILQLNMGEGKTSLIVPMLVCLIADGQQLCRVTVIKSIFETNINSLRHTLGGLLNRPVFTLPCQRNGNFTPETISNIRHSFQTCLLRKGVLLTLPELRLSFQLKGYEFARNGKEELAKPLLEIQQWLNDHARDILDESDDILSVKYQLIYTVGDHLPIGGGERRWKITQKLLKQIPRRMLELKKQLGDGVIELFPQDEAEGNPSIFPTCRLLHKDAVAPLLQKICQDFMSGRIIQFSEIKESEKPLIEKFLIDTELTEENVKQLLELPVVKESETNLETLLILSGYLRFGVLESALSKRWRVNYGVNSKSKKEIAVPYKAKDVSSERTEFGHPDMAIVLTQLSYYYSGLSDHQLTDCFNLLRSNEKLNSSAEYARWIENVPKKQVKDSVAHFEGLNLNDYEQRTILLFPILRKSMAVVDFYLNNFVFPKECKQFQGKMTTTAWDLVSKNQTKLTTGFSGTNDTQNLLPATISQHDLADMRDTNEKLEAVLKTDENHYDHFDPGVSSIQILTKLKESKIRVLLDCGALMLQFSNEEVATKWLGIDGGLQAIVFFDKKNALAVKDRSGEDCPFELSSYREKMEVTGVYLDDEHTRGTDLKFPRGSRAAVTLGSGLTRDKLVQACMRMRMLGVGHTVTFFASHEVHNKILELCGIQGNAALNGNDVLDWVKANSKKFEEDGMVYWTASAVNYCRKMGAEMIFRSHGRNIYLYV